MSVGWSTRSAGLLFRTVLSSHSPPGIRNAGASSIQLLYQPRHVLTQDLHGLNTFLVPVHVSLLQDGGASLVSS